MNPKFTFHKVYFCFAWQVEKVEQNNTLKHFLLTQKKIESPKIYPFTFKNENLNQNNQTNDSNFDGSESHQILLHIPQQKIV